MSNEAKTKKAEEGFSALAPSRRFPEFRSTGDWKPERLSRFLSESRLIGSKGDVAKKITVKLWGGGVFAKSDEIQGSLNTQYFKRKAGQFIYSKLDFLNQAFGIIPEYLDGYESTVDLPCFDMNSEICSKFLLEYVKRKDFYLKVGEAADGSRIAKRIHPETFLASEILLPSIFEQQKIADCLDSADALIAAQGRKVEALKAHKKGLMQQLFPQEGETQPRLRFPEFEGAGEWEEKPFSEIVDLISGVHLSPDEYSDSGEVPYFSGPSDFTDEVSDAKKWTASTKSSARNGDTLITVKGSGVGEVWFSKLPSVVLGRQLMAVRPKKNQSSHFVFQFLLTKKRRFEILGAGNLIPGISRPDILDLMSFFPKPPEQKRIANCLTSLDDLIAAEIRRLNTLKTHKKALMQQLFPHFGEDDA